MDSYFTVTFQHLLQQFRKFMSANDTMGNKSFKYPDRKLTV